MAADEPERSKPTIRMIAHLAQVSPTTVSLALRGMPGIPAETRERVLAAAQRLNYIYTPRGQPTPTDIQQVAFVMPDFGDRPVTANPFYGQVLSGANQACADMGVGITFTLMPVDCDTIPALLSSQPIAGVLLVGPYQRSAIECMARLDRPLVLIDNLSMGMPYDSAMADDVGGGFLATRYLIEHGHQSIAVIGSYFDRITFRERYRGYAMACSEFEISPISPISCVWDRASIRAELFDLLDRHPDLTAIFCVNDEFAVFVMEVLRNLGRQVPDDISVIGFDNGAIAHMAHPPLTTVNNHPRELGRIGIQQLLARIRGDTSPHQHIAVGTDLIIRESTRSLYALP